MYGGWEAGVGLEWLERGKICVDRVRVRDVRLFYGDGF